MKRVLITGVNGHLGRAIARQFKSQGWRVIGTLRDKRDSSKLRGLENITDELRELDLLNHLTIGASVRDVDVVIHNASPNLAWSAQPKSEIAEPILRGTRMVFKACMAQRIPKFVFAAR